MSSSFTIENLELNNYNCNQNVLLKKCFLQNLDTNKPLKEDTVDEIPNSEEWYPYVNSYYQYGEDYDAVNRVSHLLHDLYCKTTFSSESSLGTNRPSMFKTPTDCYNERLAQYKSLRKKPTSFVVLGKPDIGELMLGKLLAEHWKSVYIHPETLIEDEINSGSRAGICIEYNLRSGRSISVDVVMRLLQKQMKAASIQHRGFVICGFPLVANTLFSEDPVSSEAAVFTVHDIFEEIFDSVIDQVTVPEVVKNVSRTSKAGSVEEGYEGEEVPGENRASEFNLLDAIAGTSKMEICYQSYIHADHKDQMQFVFTLCEGHDYVIVYLKCKNEEVTNIRKDNRIDALTLHLLNLQHQRPGFFEGYQQYPGGIEPDEDNGYYASRKQLKLQRDFPVNVNAQLDRYRFESQTIIEKYILLHNPEYIIKLDGRLSPSRMFHSLKLRLRVLPLSQSSIPKLLIDRFEEDEGIESPIREPQIDYSQMTPEEWYQDLHKKKIIGKLFKWSLSDWEYLCPVAMYEGKHLQGDPNFAVSFMNKIYFLSDEEAFIKFRDNPRPYLLPPFPRPTCRCFVIGPPSSGKTSVSLVLSYMLNGVKLDPDMIHNNFIAKKHNDLSNEVKAKAINEAMDILRKQRQEEADIREVNRLASIDEYLADTKEILNRYIQCREIVSADDDVYNTLTSLPLPREASKVTSREFTECETVLPSLEIALKDMGLPVDDYNTLKQMQQDSTLLYFILPEDLKTEPEPRDDDWLGIDDPFVQDYAAHALEEAKQHMLERQADITLDGITWAIKNAEEHSKTRKGWIIDGFQPDVQLLESLDSKHMADTIILFVDISKDMEFLKTRHIVDNQNVIRNLQDFFIEQGYDEIAQTLDSLEKNSIASYTVVDQTQNKTDPNVQTEYENKCDTFRRDYDNVIEFFNSNGIPHVVFIVTDKSIEALAAEVVSYIESQYYPKPIIFTADDRAVEANEYGELQLDEEELGEGAEEKTDGQFFAENRRIGMTNKFCPVALKNRHVFWPGKEENAVKYENELYFFSSEDAMEQFIKNPKKILDEFKYGPPTIIPPARICVVGTAKIGKTTLAKALSKRLGLYYVDFDDLLKRHVRDEQVLHLYFETDKALPDGVLSSILNPLWSEEPKKSTGFVLDGFPRRPTDVTFMCENMYIPDVILELTCPDYLLHSRLLDIMLNEWQANMNLMKQEQQDENVRIYEEWKVLRQARLEELMKLKRDQRYAAKKRKPDEDLMGTEVEEEEPKPNTLEVISEVEEPVAETDVTEETNSLVSYTSIEEQEDLKEIEMMLDEELPEPGFHENWETIQIATERIQNDIDESTARENSFLPPLKEECETELIPWTSINANTDVLNVYNQAARLVMPFKYRPSTLFERVYDASVELAEKLLEEGYYLLSRFGKTCPVQMFEQVNNIQEFLAFESRFQIFPMIHKRYIYFIAGLENRLKFKEDVLKYTNQKYTQLPMILLRIAIVGPPKCGKSTISERIQYEYGLKHVSIGKSVEYVLKYLSKSILAEKVEAELRSGEYLGDDLAMACVEAMGFVDKGLALGMVMDGFPKNVGQFRELAKLNLLPHLILELDASLEHIFLYMDLNEKTHRPEYSKKFIGHRFETWEECAACHRRWIDKEYQNLAQIPVNPSKWKSWTIANTLLLDVVFEIKHYYTHKDKDIPIRISNMLVTPLEFLQRKGRFKNYCPCCLYYTNALTYGGSPPDRTGLLQFKEYFYWLCPAHIEEFIDTPRNFLDPNVRHALPIALPVKITLYSKPDQCYEDGICVICLENSKPERVFNPGTIKHAVQYNDTIYLFDTETCLNTFLSKPSAFSSVSINFRGKPYASLEISTLPTMGYLEQFDADQVVKAIIDVNAKRPMIMGLDIRTSALIHIGLFLKFRNPKTPQKYVPIFKDLLAELFDRRCNLMRSLKELKRTINPYLHYEEPIPVFQFQGFRRTLSTIEEGTTSSATTSNDLSSVDVFPPLSDTSTETVVAKVMDELLKNVEH